MAPPPLHLRTYLSPTGHFLCPRPATASRSPPPLQTLCSSSLLTEALGAESAVDPDDHVAMDDVVDAVDGPRVPPCNRQHVLLGDVFADDDANDQGFTVLRRTRSGRAFPPPISVIGKGGRPWLSLRAHREGGRLVLREMRLPSQELLQSCKEDGRFKLLMHPEAGGRNVAAGAGPRAAAAQD